MNNFNDYIAEIRASERLKKTLQLFKKGELTIEEAIEFIATDVQFHKDKVESKPWDSGITWIGGAGTTGTNPYQYPITTTTPYIPGPTLTTSVSESISGPYNSTPQ